MGEYDAFGRKAGEDPLEGLGWTHSDDAADRAPEPAPPAPAAADAPPKPPGAFDADAALRAEVQAQGRRVADAGRRVRVVARIATLLVLAGIGAAVMADRIDTQTDTGPPDITIPVFGPGDETTTPPAAPAAPPAGLSSRSLLRGANFGGAMRALRARGPGRIANLRVAADRIDVQLRTGDGRLRNVQIVPGPGVRELSVSGTGFGHVGTFPYAAVDPNAPERFVRQVARRQGRPASHVEYLVLTSFLDDLRWSLFLDDGTHFTADAHGRLQRGG